MKLSETKRKLTKAEKQAELKRQIDALKAERAAKKAAKKGKPVPVSNNSTKQNTKSDTVDEEKTQALSGVVAIQRPSDNRSSLQLQQQAAIRKRAMQKVQEQKYRELVERLSKNDILEISEMLANSANIFSFYQDFIKRYKDKNILLALNVLDKSDVELFEYIVANGFENELYQGAVQLYDEKYISLEKDKFFEYKANHPQYNVNMNTLENYLPNIYILGNQRDYNLIEAMSLKAEITLLKTTQDVTKFKEDVQSKVVLLCKQPYEEVLPSYIQVKNSQDFPIYVTFDLENMLNSQKIVPFNRDNLLQKIAFK